jgi:hypothetical protein
MGTPAAYQATLAGLKFPKGISTRAFRANWLPLPLPIQPMPYLGLSCNCERYTLLSPYNQNRGNSDRHDEDDLYPTPHRND